MLAAVDGLSESVGRQKGGVPIRRGPRGEVLVRGLAAGGRVRTAVVYVVQILCGVEQCQIVGTFPTIDIVAGRRHDTAVGPVQRGGLARGQRCTDLQTGCRFAVLVHAHLGYGRDGVVVRRGRPLGRGSPHDGRALQDREGGPVVRHNVIVCRDAPIEGRDDAIFDSAERRLVGG